MSEIEKYYGARDKRAALGQRILALLTEELGPNAPQCFHAEVLGVVFKGLQNGDHLRSVALEWSADHLVAGVLARDFTRIWKMLEQAHAKQQAETSGVADMNHADRYGRVFLLADDIRAMAVQTQNYTYMVVMGRCNMLDEEASRKAGKVAWKDGFTLRLRLCTASRNSSEPYRAGLNNGELDFLADASAIKAHPAFQYDDLRDQGYLVSVVEGPLDQATAKDVLVNYFRLFHVHHDLMSWVDTLEEELKAALAT